MNMNVFCPNCKAEYKVSDRSNDKITVKFVCYQCQHSWIDSLTEETTHAKDNLEESNKDEMSKLSIYDIKNQSQLLSSLASAEIGHSFGKENSDEKVLESERKSDLSFNFETSPSSEIITENGPTQNFPELKRQSNSYKEENNSSFEKRNNKEIEIEKRLKESSELLKKAREDTESDKPANAVQKKSNYLILYISAVLVFFIFSAILVAIFEEEIVTNFPIAEQLISKIYIYSESIFEFLKNIYFKISKLFISILA